MLKQLDISKVFTNSHNPSTYIPNSGDSLIFNFLSEGFNKSFMISLYISKKVT